MRDRILVCLYLLLAALPATAMLLELPDEGVFGALPRTKRPNVRPGSIITERFQHKFTQWFESNLGFKGRSIHLDGTVLGRVFGEAKPDSSVAIAGDVLFHREDVNGLNRTPDQIPTRAQVEAIVARMAQLQRRMREKRRLFIPVLIPNKTTIYRDRLPQRWMRYSEAHPADALYPLMKELLDAHGVEYVDTAPSMLSSDRGLTWLPTARHWSRYPACLAVREVLTRYTTRFGLAPVPYECGNVEYQDRFPDFDDFDLWRLLNADVPLASRRVPIVRHTEPPPAVAPDMLILGTSFCWTLIKDAAESKAFGRLYLDYYNATFFAMPGAEATKVEKGTPHWNDVVLHNDIYVLDVFETYMPLGPEILDDLLGVVETMTSR